MIATKVASHTAVVRHLKNIEEINEIKSDFIAIASHQLKTPISAFIYSLDGLESAYEKDDSKSFTLFLKDIKGSAHRLSLLTKNLLNVTILNNDAGTIVFQEFAVRPRIEELVHQLEPVRDIQEIELTSDITISPELQVCCDTGLFYHVLENLLTNAYKYSEKQNPVILSVEEGEQVVVISVTNAVHSLRQKDVQSMFQKFKRATTTKTTRSDGFGLGLFITKRFVESWGGEISAKLNEAESKITFSFTVLKPESPQLATHRQETSSLG